METTLTPEPPKQNFIDAYFGASLTFGMLDAVQEVAKVSQATLVNMLLHKPVRRADAERVVLAINIIITQGGRSDRVLQFGLLDIPMEGE